MYVIDRNGARIPCPHPAENSTIRKVLGDGAPGEVIRERIGFNSFCMCLNCLFQCDLDLDLSDERAASGQFWLTIMDEAEVDAGEYQDWPKRLPDERRCPLCSSPDVKTVKELVGEPCPKCKKGAMEKVWTGWIT